MDALRLHQVATGFIKDDLSEVRRYEFPSAADGAAYFSAQFNPARARRFGGSGLVSPPPGIQSINQGCYLCPQNIAWQQQGAEQGYALQLGALDYLVWMNPFPLAVGHSILATREHLPQHWADSGRSLGRLIGDLVELASALPDWITFYNGVGAGASIEGHLHFHALPRTPRLKPLPIELAADHHYNNGRLDQADPAIAHGLYPLEFAHWRGPADSTLDSARRWIEDWQDRHTGDLEATANAMACLQADGQTLDLYFVPRVRSRSRAEGFGGVIGAFETMGEIICARPDELEQIESGQISYERIAAMLAHVSVNL